MNKVIGIDISKQSFDVSFLVNAKWEHKVFSNDKKGFESLLKWVPKGWFVMEASGPYYLQLAVFDYQTGLKVSVVNPLAVRRFAQMKMYRAKTDKKDASVIAEYGQQQQPKLWQPKEATVMEMKQLFTSIELLHKQLIMSRRQIQAFEATGMVDKWLLKSLAVVVSQLKTTIEQQEKHLQDLAMKHYKSSMELLTSIPGIGKKTAALLIATTNNFKSFNNHKQLIAYVGFSPRIYQSGTSINGRAKICKMGKAQVRKMLYLCTWSAKRYNTTCVVMHKRLSEKGKPERVIKVAIANKLIKQAFAVVKNQTPFENNYSQKLVC